MLERQRLVAAAAALVLLVFATAVPALVALVALACVTAVCALLVAYETLVSLPARNSRSVGWEASSSARR